MFAVSPVIVKQPSPKPLPGGALRWVATSSSAELPTDAVVGGFERGEMLYVARAVHNRSMCPGKYVPSAKQAFVAWGHRAHKKNRFDILCGHNLMWVKTRGDVLPPHAFPGGIAAETRNEVLYIGRALIGKTNLIPGKVHLHYRTCYIPYKEEEREVYSYEVLVEPDKIIQQCSSWSRYSDGED